MGKEIWFFQNLLNIEDAMERTEKGKLFIISLFVGVVVNLWLGIFSLEVAHAEVVERSFICNTCSFVPRSGPADPAMSFTVDEHQYVDSIFLYLFNATSTLNQVNSYINKCNEDYSFCQLYAASDNYTLEGGQVGGVTLKFPSPVHLYPNQNYFWSVHPAIADTIQSGGSESDVYDNGASSNGDNIADYSFVFQGSYTGSPVQETGGVMFALGILIFMNGLIMWGFFLNRTKKYIP